MPSATTTPTHTPQHTRTKQTARFLLKGLLAVKSGKTRAQPLTGSLGYLNTLQQELGASCSARGVDCWANPGGWLCLLVCVKTDVFDVVLDERYFDAP